MKVTDFTGNKASFDHFRNGFLFYIIRDKTDDQFYYFPIPIEDTSGATFNRDEKGITLMRWIGKAIESGTMVLYKPVF